MKNLLIVLFSLFLFFTTCKKEQTPTPEVINLCCCGGTLNGPDLNIEELGYGLIYVPNAFTPNDDQINDLFFISLLSLFPNSPTPEITIDRPGLSSVVVGESWDGTFNNIDAEEGIYNYSYKLISTDTTYIFTGGKVSLIRDINNNTIFNNFPSGVENCTFGDMIDAQLGFIYSTQEDINNWGN